MTRLGIIAAAAMVGMAAGLGRASDGVARPVVERRIPGTGRRDKRREELALRSQPVPPSTETRQQRRARQRGYLS